MLYLYLKTHNITKLKYLGKTTQNPYTYKGSGIYWNRHIKKHGNDVTTVVLKECNTIEDFEYWGIYYSTLWNIVDSIEFANLVPETGTGSGNGGANKGMLHTAETKQKISSAKLASNYRHTQAIKQVISKHSRGRRHTTETKQKIGAAQSGKIVSAITKEKRKQTMLQRYGDNNPALSKEANQKRSIALKGKPKVHPQVTCPHCGKSGNKPIMIRWHFDNCKLNR